MAVTEALLKAVFDGLQEAVFVVDARTHRILFANACAGRLAGQLPRDLMGVPIEHLTATPEDQIFWRQEAKVVAQGIHSLSSLRRMDGTLVPIERRVTPCALHAPGEALLVTMLDRRAQQASERELERTFDKYGEVERVEYKSGAPAAGLLLPHRPSATR